MLALFKGTVRSNFKRSEVCSIVEHRVPLGTLIRHFHLSVKKMQLYKCPELKTLELDTINSDRLICISTVETYDFLNPLFWFTLIGRILGPLVD